MTYETICGRASGYFKRLSCSKKLILKESFRKFLAASTGFGNLRSIVDDESELSAACRNNSEVKS
jgi:hypothetical protein